MSGLALRERRVLDEREVRERLPLAPLPLAEQLLDDAERLGRHHVAGDDDGRVVRHVVARLDGAHQVEGRGAHGLAAAARVLAARVLVEEAAVHLHAQLAVGVRLVAV